MDFQIMGIEFYQYMLKGVGRNTGCEREYEKEMKF